MKNDGTTNSDKFPETDWSMVLRASGRKTAEPDQAASQALERLCSRYWRPLYLFVRSQGKSREDAEDLVQGFFTKLLRNENLKSIDEERGRFRSFLLSSMRRYLVTDIRRITSKKRGGGKAPISMDLIEAESMLATADPGLDPIRQFERNWAFSVLEVVHDAVREEYEAKGQLVGFEALSGFVTPTGDDVPYADIAAKLEIAPGTVKVRMFRLRKRFRERLREEIAFGLEDESEIDAELSYLREALRS